jgi:hypothetical protein
MINWNSKKQATVALSTAEAEYMAISATVQELKWLTQLLTEMQMKVKLPITLYCDNQAAISISENDVHHHRTKHIDIRHHYIRDEMRNKFIELKWIQSNHQEFEQDTISEATIPNHEGLIFRSNMIKEEC